MKIKDKIKKAKADCKKCKGSGVIGINVKDNEVVTCDCTDE